MNAQIVRWDSLQRSLSGQVILPGEADYRVARRVAVRGFDSIRPQAVVRCQAPEDVSEALLFARLHDIPVAPRSGGHCFAGRSSTPGIVIDVAPMAAVTMDGDRATIGAGAQLGDVYTALAGSRRTIPAGCGDDVGIAGLTLGGGLGIIGRRYGLTCDRLRAATLALADGSLVTCDAERHPDLFWALRGAGGGQFGVVTSFEFETVAAPRATAFQLTWSGAGLARVIHQWQHWAPEAPRELTASLLVTVDGADGDELEARPVATVFGTMLATEDETYAQLSGFVKLAGTEPYAADLQELSFREAKRYLGMVFAEPSVVRHHRYHSQFHDGPMSVDTTQALLANISVGLTPGQARELDFTPWGGAYCDREEGATAFAHRSQRFLLKQAVNLVVAPSHAEQRATRDWLTRTRAITAASGTGRVYPNFPDPELLDWPKAYHGNNFDRLTRVKAMYDPGNFMHFPQSIPVG